MKTLKPYTLISALMCALLVSTAIVIDLDAGARPRKQRTRKPRPTKGRGGARRGGASRGGGGAPAAAAAAVATPAVVASVAAEEKIAESQAIPVSTEFVDTGDGLVVDVDLYAGDDLAREYRKVRLQMSKILNEAQAIRELSDEFENMPSEKQEAVPYNDPRRKAFLKRHSLIKQYNALDEDVHTKYQTLTEANKFKRALDPYRINVKRAEVNYNKAKQAYEKGIDLPPAKKLELALELKEKLRLKREADLEYHDAFTKYSKVVDPSEKEWEEEEKEYQKKQQKKS